MKSHPIGSALRGIRRALSSFFVAGMLAATNAAAAPEFVVSDVWTRATGELDGNLANGPEPHFVYGIAVTSNDTLLVACEGRSSRNPSSPDWLPETFWRSSEVQRIAGEFNLLVLDSSWPAPLTRWFGSTEERVTAFCPFFHSYDQ